MAISDIGSVISADGNDVIHEMIYRGCKYEALISCEDIERVGGIDRYDHKACLNFVRRYLERRDNRVHAVLAEAEQYRKVRYRVAL